MDKGLSLQALRARLGRPQSPDLEERIAREIVAALEESDRPLLADELRQLVRGQGRRVDQVARVLVASGRLERVGRRGGFMLAGGP